MNDNTEASRVEACLRGAFEMTVVVMSETRCSAGDIIRTLYTQGELPTFAAAYFEYVPKDQLGNCHAVAMALMIDLIQAGRAYGWTWATGWICANGAPFEHSWLEYDGWVVDAACNKCLLMRVNDYCSSRKIRSVVRRNPRHSQRWINRAYGKSERTGFINYKGLIRKV